MRVILDSGASFSSFDAASISIAIGHDVTSAALSMQGVDGRMPEMYRFTPAKFDLDGFDIPPMTMLALHSPLLKTGEVEGLLGVDVMGTHRGIIDLGENLLWLK
jgi:hypothetical protein